MSENLFDAAVADLAPQSAARTKFLAAMMLRCIAEEMGMPLEVLAVIDVQQMRAEKEEVLAAKGFVQKHPQAKGVLGVVSLSPERPEIAVANGMRAFHASAARVTVDVAHHDAVGLPSDRYESKPAEVNHV